MKNICIESSIILVLKIKYFIISKVRRKILLVTIKIDYSNSWSFSSFYFHILIIASPLFGIQFSSTNYGLTSNAFSPLWISHNQYQTFLALAFLLIAWQTFLGRIQHYLRSFKIIFKALQLKAYLHYLYIL